MGKQLSSKKAKAEDTFDVADDWEEYCDALIQSINEGYLDSHLKKIAKAAYDRARELQQTPASKDKTKPKLTSVSDTGEWYPVKSVPKTADGVLIQFNGTGNYYQKREFIGKEFIVRPGTYRDNRWDGQRVRITGAGDKSFKVKFLSGTGPTGPSGLKDGEVVFINHNRASYLFDLNETSA